MGDITTEDGWMRKSRKTETDEERQERLETEAQDRARAQTAEEQTIDEMIRRSIRLHGA
jgi:hypothetical protein